MLRPLRNAPGLRCLSQNGYGAVLQTTTPCVKALPGKPIFFATAKRVDRALAPALRSVWQLEHKPHAYQRYGQFARKDLRNACDIPCLPSVLLAYRVCDHHERFYPCRQQQRQRYASDLCLGPERPARLVYVPICGSYQRAFEGILPASRRYDW